MYDCLYLRLLFNILMYSMYNHIFSKNVVWDLLFLYTSKPGIYLKKKSSTLNIVKNSIKALSTMCIFTAAISLMPGFILGIPYFSKIWPRR